MKTAISGKDGVGKVLVTAFLTRISASSGLSTTATGASPGFNSDSHPCFPHPDKFTPILELNDLIEECVGVRSGASGSFFKFNPKVNDLQENYSVN